MKKFNVDITILTGKLIEGEAVTGSSYGITDDGKDSFKSTWSGTYTGMEILGGEYYHMFRDGEINGAKQTRFGSPMYQFF